MVTRTDIFKALEGPPAWVVSCIDIFKEVEALQVYRRG